MIGTWNSNQDPQVLRSTVKNSSHCIGKVKLKSLSCVRLFATPWTVAYQAPLSMGFFQAIVLEWIAISFSRGSSWPRDRTQVSCIVDGRFTVWATKEVHYIGNLPLKASLYRNTKYWNHAILHDIWGSLYMIWELHLIGRIFRCWDPVNFKEIS